MSKLRFKKGLLGVMSIGLLMALSGCWGQKKTKRIYTENLEKAPYDAIIVTGVPFNGETWDQVMMLRVYWAKYLYENGLTNNIIFSGSAVYTEYVEAEIMRLYALKLGIPDEVIHTEPRAEHSSENVYYSLLMGYKLGFEKMALATDPYQLYFMRNVFKRKGVNLSYLPMDYDILGAIDKPEPEIDPSSAKVVNFVPLTERESFVQRVRGTRGKNVDFTNLK